LARRVVEVDPNQRQSSGWERVHPVRHNETSAQPVFHYCLGRRGLWSVFALEFHEHMRVIAANSMRPGLTNFAVLIALAMAVSMVSLRSSVAEESGTRAIPLPPVPIIRSFIQNANVQQEADRRDETRSDIDQMCMEPDDERICEMELELGEITIPH
jgi:hypothetical protein